MDTSPPNWREAGWLDGRYGHGNNRCMLPTKEAQEAYDRGYAEGLEVARRDRTGIA